MASKRRSRRVGQGMTPLLDLEVLTSRDPARTNPARPGRDAEAGAAGSRPTVTTPRPTTAADGRRRGAEPRVVGFIVTGVFQFPDGHQRAHEVHAVGHGDHLRQDVARFLAYLRIEGYAFAEGRGTLVTHLKTSRVEKS